MGARTPLLPQAVPRGAPRRSDPPWKRDPRRPASRHRIRIKLRPAPLPGGRRGQCEKQLFFSSLLQWAQATNTHHFGLGVCGTRRTICGHTLRSYGPDGRISGQGTGPLRSTPAEVGVHANLCQRPDHLAETPRWGFQTLAASRLPPITLITSREPTQGFPSLDPQLTSSPFDQFDQFAETIRSLPTRPRKPPDHRPFPPSGYIFDDVAIIKDHPVFSHLTCIQFSFN